MATDDFKPGQLRGGWNQLARDLDRAFAIGLFSPSQSFLIQRARELSWAEARMKGSMEPLPFRLNISELAKIAGCNRQWLSEAFSTLVKCRLFTSYKENLYIINKDYRLWLTPDGKPRLTDAQVAWCREVVRDWAESDEQDDPDVAPMSGNPDSELSTLSGKTDRVSGKPDSEQASPVGKTRHTCRENPTLGVPPIPPSSERREEVVVVVADDSKDAPLHPSNQTPLRSAGHPGSTPLERLIAWARDVLGEQAEMENFASCIHASVRSRYPLDWIEEAVVTAQANVNRRFATYVNGCLRRWHSLGGIPRPPAPAPAVNGAVPHPVRKETPQERERRISDGIRKSAYRIKALEDEL